MFVGEEKEVEIQELFDLAKEGGVYEIETPQGWVEIGDLITKDNKECYRIRTESGKELCGSSDHYVETTNGWKSLEAIDVNTAVIKTSNGDDPIVAKEYVGVEKTYDLEVKNDEHKYYANGIVSHNTGKTMICKVLAKDLPCSVVYVLPSHIANIQCIDRICEMAKDLSPTLIIIEDIDWMAEDRQSSAYSGITIELMNKLDGIENFSDVITLATTNLPGKIEEAVKNRPGRFDRVVNIGLPDRECRLRMLKKFTSNFIIDLSVNWDKVAQGTDKMSGAYLYNLCSTAAVCAVNKNSLSPDEIIILKQEHFDEALKEIKDKDCTAFQNGKPTGPIGFGSNDKD